MGFAELRPGPAPAPAPVGPATPGDGTAEPLVVQEWAVRWGLYGDPPEGMPQVLAREGLLARDCDGARRGDLVSLVHETQRDLPRGYALYWTKRQSTAEVLLGMQVFAPWWSAGREAAHG